MNRTQKHIIEELRRRLAERAWLAEDGTAYRDGVEDALDEVVILLDEAEERVPVAR